MRSEQQRSCAVGWRGVLCWERDAPTLSLFLPSAADNSKDLATELVHYGFIHEVRLLIRCTTVCACTVPQQHDASCLISHLQPGAATWPGLQLCAALLPLHSASLFDFSGLCTSLPLF